MIIRCPNCNTENPDENTYCFRCHSLLRLPHRGDTNVLPDDEIDSSISQRNWGTARFDEETILLLTARDYSAAPLRVRLDADKIVGRAHNGYIPDIDLSHFDAYERGVSRQHAILRHLNNTVVLIDMNSANSTFLNGQRLMPDQPRILRDGDEIRLGQLVLRIGFTYEVRE